MMVSSQLIEYLRSNVELQLAPPFSFGIIDCIWKYTCTQLDQRNTWERKAIHQATSSTHLVDMDGLLSLNEIQRLLGKKLAIGFNGLTIPVNELDVKVVGRVALVLERV